MKDFATSCVSGNKRSLKNRRAMLIIPPSPFLLDERVFVSLGILRVASALEARGAVVGVLDLSGVKNFLELLETFLIPSQAEWIGITVTTPQLPYAVEIARKIRQLKPKLRVILGGPHVTLCYSALKRESKDKRLGYGRATLAVKVLEKEFDVLVSGDGELASSELFSKNCPRFIDGDDNHGSYFLSNAQYEALPLPSRHLVDLTSYNYRIEECLATSLIAQLGCPFSCGFCGGRESKSLRVVRRRSVSSVVAEMRWLYEKYGFTGFMFYDDELNVNKDLVQLLDSIVHLQKELGVEFRLRGFIKAELFSSRQADAMYRAGFRWILCGFESANARILENMEKRAAIEDNTKVVSIAKEFGLKVKALMSVGHPGENEKSIIDIQDWLIASRIDDFDCTVITTYPGTPYYDLAQKNLRYENVWTFTHPKTKDRLHAYEIDYTKTSDFYKGNPNGGYRSYVFTDYLTSEDIVNLRDKVELNVREKLKIPFPSARQAEKKEHIGDKRKDLYYRESFLA